MAGYSSRYQSWGSLTVRVSPGLFSVGAKQEKIIWNRVKQGGSTRTCPIRTVHFPFANILLRCVLLNRTKASPRGPYGTSLLIRGSSSSVFVWVNDRCGVIVLRSSGWFYSYPLLWLIASTWEAHLSALMCGKQIKNNTFVKCASPPPRSVVSLSYTVVLSNGQEAKQPEKRGN